MRRLGFLVRKEFQELRRNPRMFPVIFIAPVIQLFILGYAATTDVKNVPLIVLDADRSAESRDLIGRFEGSPYFSIAGVTSSDAEVQRAIESRRAWMALSIPPQYGEMIGRQRAGDRAGHHRRHRLELGHRRPGVRVDAHHREGRGAGGRRAAAGRAAHRLHRGAHPRLVQPAAAEPALHGAGRPGPAADDHHDRARRRWPSCARRNWARSSSSTSRR